MQAELRKERTSMPIAYDVGMLFELPRLQLLFVLFVWQILGGWRIVLGVFLEHEEAEFQTERDHQTEVVRSNLSPGQQRQRELTCRPFSFCQVVRKATERTSNTEHAALFLRLHGVADHQTYSGPCTDDICGPSSGANVVISFNLKITVHSELLN